MSRSNTGVARVNILTAYIKQKIINRCMQLSKYGTVLISYEVRVKFRVHAQMHKGRGYDPAILFKSPQLLNPEP